MIYTSDELGSFAEALSHARKNYKKLIPNEPCAGGMYANLDAINAATVDALEAEGLSFNQMTELKDEGSGAALMWSWLIHKSGQYMKSGVRVVEGGIDREADKRNQARRRQQACMILGISPSRNDPDMLDDDGDGQAKESVMDDLKSMNRGEAPTKQSNYETISTAQFDDIMIELSGYQEIAKDIQRFYGIQTLADMPKSEYHKSLAKIRSLKDEYKRYRENLARKNQ